MPLTPRLTVVVAATDADPDGLRRTISSVDRSPYPHVALVVVGDEPSAKLAATFAGEAAPVGDSDDKYGPGDFLTGRTVGNTPFSVHLLGGGFSFADAVNLAVAETRTFTDFYVPLRAGDELHPNAPDQFAAAFAEDVTQVGGVWADHYAGGLRVYEEPFDRGRLRGTHPRAHAVSRLALDLVGDYGPGLWEKLAGRFVIVHTPDPLVRTRPRAD